jgi:enoyl-CoA hydratase/carnithine racemase
MARNDDCLWNGPVAIVAASFRPSSREQIEQAAKVELGEFALRVRSPEAKEAFTAFIEKRPPDFTKIKEASAK